VVKTNGHDLEQLTSSGNNLSPVWSPDGENITFTHEDFFGGNVDVYAMAADGSAWRNITADPATDLEPDWGASR